MTEFELADLLLHRMDIMSEFAGLYFTLVSAYLLVSYLVGDKLSVPQLTIISALYVLWVAGLINGSYHNYVDASVLVVELERLKSITYDRPVDSMVFLGTGFVLVQISGLLASLYFMWSIRRRKG